MRAIAERFRRAGRLWPGALAVLALGIGAPPAQGAALSGSTGAAEVFSCGQPVEAEVLSGLSYAETATATVNDVTYEPRYTHRVFLVQPIGPSPPCAQFESPHPERHLFADRGGTLRSASGRCSASGPRLGVCEGPSVVDHAEGTPLTTDPTLPVDIDLGRRNDHFETVIDPVTQGVNPVLRIEVTAGPGRDGVRLVDLTSDGSNRGWPGAGTDSVSCGAGTDSVVATTATVVASDCENVTRVP